MHRELPRTLLPLCYDALMASSGKPRAFVHTAYRMWQRSAPAETCRYGKEKAVAYDCPCDGCHRSLMFLYFDTVANRLGAPLSTLTKGFDQ